jgi:hypothetical protein
MFGSSTTIIDFEWIDFLKSILSNSELMVKTKEIYVLIQLYKSELNNKFMFGIKNYKS